MSFRKNVYLINICAIFVIRYLIFWVTKTVVMEKFTSSDEMTSEELLLFEGEKGDLRKACLAYKPGPFKVNMEKELEIRYKSLANEIEKILATVEHAMSTGGQVFMEGNVMLNNQNNCQPSKDKKANLIHNQLR